MDATSEIQFTNPFPSSPPLSCQVNSTISEFGGRDSPVVFAPNSESEEWLREWQSVNVKELIDCPIVPIDANTTVEDACETLLSKDIACLAIKSSTDQSISSTEVTSLLGLFDFADVNAFLVLAATQHKLTPEQLSETPRLSQIVDAAKAGHVPVSLVSNLSEKNPLEILPEDSTIVELLGVFASGTHRALIRSSRTSSCSLEEEYLGFVTDRALLSYFAFSARRPPSFTSVSNSPEALSSSPNAPLTTPLSASFATRPHARFLQNALATLALPGMNLRSAVVAAPASATVLDAMAKMNSMGVSSVAVIEDQTLGEGRVGGMKLLSAVSVTDIGKKVVPSQSKQILQMPLLQFVSMIKEHAGSMDGEDRYPVYSVSAASTLRYTIEKILATNAHRVFISEETGSRRESISSGSGGSSPIVTGTCVPQTSDRDPTSNTSSPQLRGVVSVIDILALFARLAGLPDVDPARMQKHRRASSVGVTSTSPSSSLLHPPP